MLELFSPVKTLIEQESVRIENFVFRLHSRLTVLLLLVCMILVSAKQYFGEPISCITDGTIERDSINIYCWIYGTFTVSRHLTGVPGRSVASPGVGGTSEMDEHYHHRYYQWVSFVLGLQAILFYIPRALWSSWERGLIASLTKNLGNPFPKDSFQEQHSRRLVQYFFKRAKRTNNFYAACYSFCELLNLINTIGQIYVLDALFDGQFRGYGSAVISYAMDDDQSFKINPMARVFPKVSKCTFRTFGATGSLQVHDALCVLALNVVNEKVFAFLWLWFMLLATAGFLTMIYRIIVFAIPCARVYLLQAGASQLSRINADRIVHGLCYSDWFLLRRLAVNIDPLIYTELLENLAISVVPKIQDSVA